MKLLGLDRMDTKFSKCRNGSFVAVAVISMISACAPEAACVMIDDPMTVQKLNEAVRPEVEYFVKADNYTFTLERKLSNSAVVYSDCGSHYLVVFTPFSYDPEFVAIGATTTYTVSKGSMKVTSVVDD